MHISTRHTRRKRLPHRTKGFTAVLADGNRIAALLGAWGHSEIDLWRGKEKAPFVQIPWTGQVGGVVLSPDGAPQLAVKDEILDAQIGPATHKAILAAGLSLLVAQWPRDCAAVCDRGRTSDPRGGRAADLLGQDAGRFGLVAKSRSGRRCRRFWPAIAASRRWRRIAVVMDTMRCVLMLAASSDWVRILAEGFHLALTLAYTRDPRRDRRRYRELFRAKHPRKDLIHVP